MTGLGEGKYYIGQEGYLRQFRELLGFPPMHGTLSHELSRLLELHVRAALAIGRADPSPPVTRHRWPTVALEGIDMPAAVLYVGRAGQDLSFPGDKDWQMLDQLSPYVTCALHEHTSTLQGSISIKIFTYNL